MSGDVTAQTPMMRQYNELKKSIPENTLLLFRLGDFYELFGNDAITGSKILGITLTKRQTTPMAGIPHHAADVYIEKLINAGYKIAICEQTEPPKPGKIVNRKISKILSPGTVITENLLNPSRNQYLLSLKFLKNRVAIAWIEVSTGEFQISDAKNICELEHIIFALNPREIVVDSSDRDKFEKLSTREKEALYSIFGNRLVTDLPYYYFDHGRSLELLLETLKVGNLYGYGIENEDFSIVAAGALVLYVKDNLKQSPNNLRKILKFKTQNTMIIDANTLRNLDVLRNSKGGKENTLLSLLDYTKTAIGARLLEKFIIEPSINCGEIIRRQEIVNAFLGKFENIGQLKKSLCNIADIPRILTRISNNIRNPREIASLRATLQQLPEIVEELSQFNSNEIKSLIQKIDILPDLYKFLNSALSNDLPNDTTSGGYIADNFDERVDYLRKLSYNSSEWLCNFERDEQLRTGIKNLKVKYNNNFGYFIEITKSNIHLAPSDYIRRQTTVNSERYITESLKEKEKEILSANDQLIALEQAILKEIIDVILKNKEALYINSEILSEIDVLSGWAQLAKNCNYCRPEITTNRSIEIKGGRHPIVEKIIKESDFAVANMRSFIANDTILSSGDIQIALITGPNMAGKSTYIRQVALIVIMAQIGCNVPADSCKICLTDRIFSRIGANDDLASGASTFMVEMNETANILNNATESSLIILDEVGRGTSTYDGLSIAWAIVEFLHENWSVGPKVLFATHYHELTKLSEKLVRVKNYHVAVKEWNDEVIFLRSIEPGAADKSYGIHVARLAGMPISVIDRASDILENLESGKDNSRKIFNKISNGNKSIGQLDLGL